jgi:hypothetical protein
MYVLTTICYRLSAICYLLLSAICYYTYSCTSKSKRPTHPDFLLSKFATAR